MKKWIALALILVLCVGVATGVILDPGPREKHLRIPHRTTYSDFGAYGKWRIDMLNSISMYSPEKKALYINFILDKKLYEYCLKETIYTYQYYDFKVEELKFKNALSGRANYIYSNFEKVNKAFDAEESKGYHRLDALVTFKPYTPYTDIRLIAENIGSGFEILEDESDNYGNITAVIEGNVYGDLYINTQQFLEVLKDIPCVESVDYYREGLRQPGE